jgi:ribonuclease J
MDSNTGDLAFLPLGGTGEIGMNLNLYRCEGSWLAVDCGIGFGGSEMPEVEIMLPDASFIAARKKDLVGLIITHAHEDHIGGVAWLWRELRCPVYATPFAAAVLRRKLAEAGLLNEVPLHVVPLGGSVELAPFSVQFIAVSHSVPEAQALCITTPQGVIVHTGDWKMDAEPMVGQPTDAAAFRAIGDRGVLALVCDSTNALVEGTGGSEATVRANLTELIGSLTGRVAVTCFASNVARVESVALAAEAAGRSVALVGRSLRNLDAAARSCGYLRGVPAFLGEDDLDDVPDDNLLMLITGSQGEPRSALARIAADQHRNVALGEGDTVIFSSSVIPGNERAIGAVQDNLVRHGVQLITAEDALIHVSGHPGREDLRQLYDWVRPQISVPVHGEWRHLSAHAALAQELGVKPMLLENGDILSLSASGAQVVDSAPVGRLAVDGGRLVPLSGGVLAARRRMLFNGVVLASVAVDAQGRLRGPAKLSAPGLFEAEDPEALRVGQAFATLLGEMPGPLLQDEEGFAEAARSALRRALGRRLQKRPLVDVHVLRV